MNYSADIQKLPRHFLPTDFSITNWQGLEPVLRAFPHDALTIIDHLSRHEPLYQAHGEEKRYGDFFHSVFFRC